MNSSNDRIRGFTLRLPILGVVTRFETNSPAVRDALESAYGSWAKLADALVSPSEVCVQITEGEVAPVPDNPGPHYFAPDRDRMLVVADGAVGTADAKRREALLYVAPELASRGTALVEGLVDALVLTLITGQDREPVHAAAVGRGEAAVLLAGPSGAGKSTLTYAAARGGLSVLADEPVYVQLEPTLRVWGRRARTHISVEAVEHFGELRETAPVELPTGKTKIVVEPASSLRRHAERPGLCILERGGTVHAPRLVKLDPDKAVEEMMSRLDEGYHLFADTLPERIRRIAECGAWRLSVGGTPDQCVPLLTDMLDALSA